MHKVTTFFVTIFIILLPLFASAACKTNLPFHKANRFIDNQDGTVTDTLTNLMWMRCPLGRNWDATTSSCEIPFDKGSKRLDVQDTWNAVMVAANDFNIAGGFAGASDWRVPNIKEMASISMLHCYPPIDTSVFPDAGSSIGAKQFWTSTPSRKVAKVDISDDPQNPVYEYRTQAWTFSIVDARNAGKALEAATNEKHHVLLVRDLLGQSQ